MKPSILEGANAGQGKVWADAHDNIAARGGANPRPIPQAKRAPKKKRTWILEVTDAGRTYEIEYSHTDPPDAEVMTQITDAVRRGSGITRADAPIVNNLPGDAGSMLRAMAGPRGEPDTTPRGIRPPTDAERALMPTVDRFGIQKQQLAKPGMSAQLPASHWEDQIHQQAIRSKTWNELYEGFRDAKPGHTGAKESADLVNEATGRLGNNIKDVMNVTGGPMGQVIPGGQFIPGADKVSEVVAGLLAGGITSMPNAFANLRSGNPQVQTAGLAEFATNALGAGQWGGGASSTFRSGARLALNKVDRQVLQTLKGAGHADEAAHDLLVMAKNFAENVKMPDGKPFKRDAKTLMVIAREIENSKFNPVKPKFPKPVTIPNAPQPIRGDLGQSSAPITSPLDDFMGNAGRQAMGPESVPGGSRPGIPDNSVSATSAPTGDLRSQLERRPSDELDMEAFGFKSGDVITVDPKKTRAFPGGEDEINVAETIKRSGLSPRDWALTVNLDEPIEITLRNGELVIENGHHRATAAKILGRDVRAVVSIDDNPIDIILSKTDPAPPPDLKLVTSPEPSPSAGGSQLGDEFFHGTQADFEKFEVGKSRNYTGGPLGSWFTKNRGYAEAHGDIVKTVKLNIANPYVMSDEQWKALVKQHSGDSEWFASWRESLQAKGHDGVRVKGKPEEFMGQTMPGTDNWAAFTDDQIEILDQGRPKQPDGAGASQLGEAPNLTSKDKPSVFSSAERHLIYKMNESDLANAHKFLMDELATATDPKRIAQIQEILGIYEPRLRASKYPQNVDYVNTVLSDLPPTHPMGEQWRLSVENAEAAKRAKPDHIPDTGNKIEVDPLDAEMEAVDAAFRSKYAKPEPTSPKGDGVAVSEPVAPVPAPVAVKPTPVKAAPAKGNTRNFISGPNRATITFASDEQRLLYDYEAASKALRGDRGRAQDSSVMKSRRARMDEIEASMTPEQLARSKSVYDDVRAQMKGVEDGEVRAVKDNTNTPKPVPVRKAVPVKATKPVPVKAAVPEPAPVAKAVEGEFQAPQEGDKVFQVTRGPFGGQAVVNGEVYRAKNGALRVRVIGGSDQMGIGQTKKGATYPIEGWKVKGDPEIARRAKAKEVAESEAKAAREQSYAAEQSATQERTQKALRNGDLPLTNKSPIGAKVTDHATGETSTIVGHDPHYGPLLSRTSKEAPFTVGGKGVDVYEGYTVNAPKQAKPRKLPTVQSISDFDPLSDRVIRKGERVYVHDTRGVRADVEVQSDALTPETEANLRAIPENKLAEYRAKTEATHVLSPEGKAERLRIFDERMGVSSPSKRQSINAEIEALTEAQAKKNAKRPTPRKGGRSGAYQRLDAEDLELAGKLAVLYVRKGAATIEEFAKTMIEHFAKYDLDIRPHIQELWDAHGPKSKTQEPKFSIKDIPKGTGGATVDQPTFGMGKLNETAPDDVPTDAPTWADKAGDLITNAKLTLNPLGRVKDVASNLTKLASEAAVTPGMKVAIAIMNKKGMTQAKVFQGVPWAKSGLFDEGFWKTVKSDIKDVWKGADTFADKKFGNAGIGRKIAGTGDVPFRETYFRSHMRDSAITRLLSRNAPITDDALKQAIREAPASAIADAKQYAAKMTFNADNALGDLQLKIRGMFREAAKNNPNKAGRILAGQALFDASTRFTRVIANVAKDKLRYSPVGLYEGVSRFAKAAKASNKGVRKLSFDEARGIAELLSKGTVGSLGMAMGYMAWKNKIQHGELVESKNSAYQDMGAAEQAIAGIGPAYMIGQQIAFAQERGESTKGKSDDRELWHIMALQLAKAALDSPFFNPSALVESRDIVDQLGELLVSQLPLSELARRSDAMNENGKVNWRGLFFDRPIQKPSSTLPMSERMKQRAMAQVPGLRGHLPKKEKPVPKK